MRLIDMHCDTLSLMMQEKDVNLKSNHLGIDLKKMKAAGSIAQFFACFIHISEFIGEDRFTQGYQHALKMISYGKRIFADCLEDISIVRSYDELIENGENGKISAFLTVEEGGIIENDMSRLDMLYKEGVRLITLTWNYENSIAYPNSSDLQLMQLGLKSFGIEVVERMNELGMIIDVSHLSDGGFWDVHKYSKKPVVASHSNARALCAHPRNLTDEMILALAKNGGIAGINLYPYFLNESGKATIEDIVNHVVHMYQVGGEDFVAIGTDFDGFDDGESEIVHMGQMEKVYAAVRKRGFTERQMEKFWAGNTLRVIKEVLH